MTVFNADAIYDNEILLACLACEKLTGLVLGACSVGLPFLVSDFPEPLSFWEDRFRVMTAFAVVLDTIAGPPTETAKIAQLREKSGQVLDGLEIFHTELTALLDVADPSLMNFAAAREAASTLCDAIDEYAKLIGLDSSSIVKVKSIVLQVLDGIDDLIATHATAAG
jgi:hypothetical protein